MFIRTTGLGEALAIAATCLLGVIPLAVHAQDGADDVIVVEGERIEAVDIRNTAREITVGARAAQEPLARFQRPICPGVWGLSEANAQAVIDRIFANARRAGVPVNEEPRCGANIWVIFVDDAGATFERLDDEESHLTRHLTRHQKRRVRAQEGAARGWSLLTTRNEMGRRILDGFEYTLAYREALAMGEPPPTNDVSSVSRLKTGIRKDIELSVVLIDRAALAEVDAHAVADYATMRLLAYTEPPDREASVATVLSLFMPGAKENVPQRMTVFDVAYLQSLYRGDEMQPARFALGNIGKLMKDGEADEE